MDFRAIDVAENLDKVAIVAVGYNRLQSIKRLLQSLEKGNYGTDKVPLLISIDASGDTELYDYVRGYKWPYGELYVRIFEERQGLKEHLVSWGDISKDFRAVIILEDDIFVSPVFYTYTKSALDAYESDDSVCGVALYAPKSNGYVGMPFIPMHKGHDVYLYQDVCTWGECVTYGMWKRFREWLAQHEKDSFEDIEMPRQIKNWGRAWSKYYYAYMVENGMSFVTPYVGYATNCGEAGEHSLRTTSVAQVPLEMGHRLDLIMPRTEDMVSYDAYSNNKAIYEWLNLSEQELTLDLYGNNECYDKRHYVLTTLTLPYKIVREFGLSFYPIEANIYYNQKGSGIRLYDTTATIKTKKRDSRNEYNYLSYYLIHYNYWSILRYAIHYGLNAIKRKLGI